VAFSPNGTTIAAGGGDNTIRLWDASTGAARGALTGHTSAVETVAFSPDGLRLVSGGDDQTIRIWDISGTQPLLGHENIVMYAEFSSDGQRIRSGSMDGTVRQWAAATGQPIGQPRRVPDHVRWLVPVGEDRVLSRGDAGLRLWDSHTGEPIGEPLRVLNDPMLPAGSWNPNSGRIAAQTESGAIEIRDAEMRPLGVPIWPGQPLTYFDFSPDGEILLTSSFDSTIRLWNVETGKPVGKPLEANGLILTIAFSPDGHMLAAGTQGGTENAPNTLRLWDTQTSQLVGDPIRVDSVVSATAFSPDGRTLATGSSDGTIRLWDVATHMQRGAPLGEHTSLVTNVTFNPDGTKLVSTGADQALRIWPIPKASPEALCAKLTRNMSRDHWNEWVSPEIDYITACPGLPIAGGN
jgi:WD40 repeat protein